jgi:hypothetical protein
MRQNRMNVANVTSGLRIAPAPANMSSLAFT